MPSRNKIKNKTGKKKKFDTELAKIDSEKNTDREEVALHLLFVKVPQIHVNLQLLLQNLILFLQEFILNLVFVVVTAAQLRLRHFRNPAPMFTNYTTSEYPEALDQNKTLPTEEFEREKHAQTHTREEQQETRARGTEERATASSGHVLCPKENILICPNLLLLITRFVNK
jgi:hypothetical protein